MSTNGSEVCAYSYTVKRGDSFYLIANRLGVPLNDLLNANSAIHPARLMVGDVLCIPQCDAQTPAIDSGDAASDGSTQTDDSTGSSGAGESATGDAAAGDTASDTGEPSTGQTTGYICPEDRKISVAEGQTATDLQLEYGLNYRTLERANNGVDLTELQAGDTVCVPSANFACAYPGTVTLAQNDTLESIAMQYNLSISALLRANPCLAPNQFIQGITIRLP